MNPRHPRRRGLHAVGQPMPVSLGTITDPDAVLAPTAEVIDHGPAPVQLAGRDHLADAVRAELLADDWRADVRAQVETTDLVGLTCAEDDARYPDPAVHESCANARIEAESVPFERIPSVEEYDAEFAAALATARGDAVGSGGDGWAEVEAASDADLDAGGPLSDELGRVADWASRHDARSLEYSVRARLNVRAPLQDRVWPHGPIFDQGMSPPRSLHDASGCTGYSMTAAINICRPDLRLADGDAFDLYLAAQKRDSVPGEAYAGTSVLAAAAEAKARGWINAYLWCFGVGDVAQALLQVGPVVLGIPWLTQMQVDADGVLTPAGDRGGLGHAIACIGIVREHAGKPGPWFVLQQSYGSAVGVGGLLYLHADHLRLLLRGVGEACVPIIATKETP